MYTISIHAWLHCQSYFNYTKSVIHNVSKSEMLPIMYISSGRSHQNSRLPMPFHFPNVSGPETSHIKPSGLWRNLLRNRVDFQQTFINQTDILQNFSLIKNSHVLGIFLSYVGRYPIEVIDGISFRMLVVTPLR